MKTYVIRLQDSNDLSVKVIVVHNATSEDNAEEKAERAGWLDDHAILGTLEVSDDLS